MECPLWLGRWIVWGDKIKVREACARHFIISSYFSFYKPSLTTWKSLCAVYKIMNSKWRAGSTNRPSNFVNNFCFPIWLPVIAFSSQITSMRWNRNTYDACLEVLAVRHGGMPATRRPSDKKGILRHIVIFPLLIYIQARVTWRTKAPGDSLYSCIFSPMCGCAYSLTSLPIYFFTFELLFNMHTRLLTHMLRHACVLLHGSLKLQSGIWFQSVSWQCLSFPHILISQGTSTEWIMPFGFSRHSEYSINTIDWPTPLLLFLCVSDTSAFV